LRARVLFCCAASARPRQCELASAISVNWSQHPSVQRCNRHIAAVVIGRLP
jgi:hypothetical protein